MGDKGAKGEFSLKANTLHHIRMRSSVIFLIGFTFWFRKLTEVQYSIIGIWQAHNRRYLNVYRIKFSNKKIV